MADTSSDASPGGAGGMAGAGAAGAMLDAVKALRAMDASARAAAVAEVAASTGAPAELVAAVADLPEESLTSVTGAVASIVDSVASASAPAAGAGGGGRGGGGGGGRAAQMAAALTALPAEAVATLASTFKDLPAPARRAALTMVPEQARPVAVAAQFMSPEQLSTLVRQAPELAAAMQEVAGLDDGESEAGEGKAGDDDGDGDGAAASASGAPAPGSREARLAAAVKLHRAYRALPQRARAELSLLVPEQARPAVQLAEGVSESDMAVVLDALDEQRGVKPMSSGAASAAAPITGGTAVDSGGAAKDAATTDSGSGSGSGGGGEAKEDEASATRRKALAGARLVARSEARRLWRWVRGDPCGLRVLNFLGGAALCFAGVSGILIQTFNEFRVWMIVLEAYIAALGLVMAAVEVESELCARYVAAHVQHWLGFLSTSTGRAHYLMFVGLLSLSIWDPTTRGWTELFNIGAGLYVLVLALVNYAAGHLAERKMAAAAARVASVEDLRRRFEAADVAMRGSLAPEDVVSLLADLEPPTLLSDAELRSAVLALDTNRDGGIQLDELLEWYAGAPTGPAAAAAAAGATSSTAAATAAPAGGDGAAAGAEGGGGDAAVKGRAWFLVTGGPTSLRVLTLLCGLFYAASGFIGIWTQLLDRSRQEGNRGTFVLGALLDVYIVALGLFVAALEARVTLCGVNVPLAVSRNARVFGRVLGRGFFYQFLGFVALSQWSLAELANILAGFAMLGVGVANTIVGWWTMRALAASGLRGGTASVAEAEARFAAADADGDGTLDTTEFAALVRAMGVELTRPQLEAAFCEVDRDGSGRIDLREFLMWSQSSEAEADVRAAGSASATAATPLLAPGASSV